jgi:OPA family sugar phosphate sensor protein UhpC-like MFS transporter
VLLNPYIWLLSLCYVLVYVVRAAINDWGNLYMSETLGVDLVTANSAVTMFELGGFIGALVAGWGSDKLFNGNRGPMNLIFAAGILLSVGGLWLMPFASYVMQAACFFTTGFFVFGPQMLIGMAAAECSHKEAAGAATGFVGLFAYLGASLSGWPLAQVMEIWHWSGFSWHRYCRRHFRAAAAAVFKRSGAKNRQRSVTCLSFLPRVGQN